MAPDQPPRSSTVLLLAVLLALFLGYRLATTGQVDDAQRLQGKHDYLAQIGSRTLHWREQAKYCLHPVR